jgi:molecular chaperone DnaJ
MRPERDYYEILGVDHRASQTEIKRAFRRLARRHHPDVNPNDPDSEARFKEISQAYQVLCDPQRRAHYDAYGEAGPVGAAASDLWGDLAGFGDLFEAFFGGRQRAPTREAIKRGSDLRYDLEVALEQVAGGAEISIVLERLDTCAECEGTGSRSRAPEQTCSRCRGSGQVRHETRTVFGHLSTVTACTDCRGAGTCVGDPCPECRGRGRRPAELQVPITIPAGIEDGGSWRITGEGEAGERGGPRGDLYLVAHIQPHEVFQRRGRELFCEALIPFTTAALGGPVTVPTIDGAEDVYVPPGTQTGESFTLRGKGLPDVRTGIRGSQHVSVKVVTPTHLTREQRKLLEQFAKEGGDQVEHPETWLTRLRKALSGPPDG